MAQTLIQTVTVGAGGASSIDFNGIPSTFTDLVIYLSGRSNVSDVSGGQSVRMRFNGTTTTYTGKILYGTGSYAGSYSPAGWAGQVTPSNFSANNFSNTVITIPNYGSSLAKSWSADAVSENNSSVGSLEINAGSWNGTAAITSISLTIESGSASFQQYTTASLYGVSKVQTPGVAKATGGTITYGQMGYVYHTFTTSGTFTPTVPLTVDYMIVAGGGGGGGSNAGRGGGGGAGGLRAFTGQTISTAAAVTVGAGGAAGADNVTGYNGNTTSFNSSNVTGGGGGSSNNSPFGQYWRGNAGGSGGGSMNSYAGGAGNAGGYSPVEGYAGGGNTGNYAGGGGGGAGGVGAGISGAGGSGANAYNGIPLTDWFDATGTGNGGYIAGGGGTSGGIGGGGSNSAGMANTGGGGSQLSPGGSGLVIIRYRGV